MSDLSISTDVLVHGIHYAVLGVALIGLLLLIGPQLLGRDPRPGNRDEHDRRVAALDQQIASGSLGSSLTTLPLALAPRTEPVAATDLRASLLLPVAIVSSAAAAGVHAAVGPEHFRERVLFGAFFAGCALAQILWAAAAVFRPTRRLLELGVLGNLAVVALWALTRTVGLGSLLPAPEAVGTWDLACVLWEVVAAGSAWVLVRSRLPLLGLPRWTDWDRRARAWAFGSVLALAVLPTIGANA